MLLRPLNLKAPDASHPARVRRLTIIVALAMLGVIGLFAAYKFVGEPLMIKFFIGKAVQPPQTVAAQAAEARAWQPSLTAVGTLVAVQGADLSTEVDGIVREVNFTSGDTVAAGMLLVRLDDEILIAQLNQRQADADNAEREFQRSAKLAAQGHASGSDLDAARSRRDQAVAAVAQARALADQKLIKAPFAGRTGVRRVTIGEFVKASAPIVTLQTLQPLYVNFDLPEQSLARMSNGQAVTLTTDTYPGQSFTGTLTSYDPKIDPATRTFLAQATVANEDGKLAPGMFARVGVAVGAPAQIVSVPETAVTYSLSGDTVFVVGQAEEGKPRPVEQRRVTLGESRNGSVAILSGVTAGELVVTEGGLKLYPGATVTVSDAETLDSSAKMGKY